MLLPSSSPVSIPGEGTLRTILFTHVSRAAMVLDPYDVSLHAFSGPI